MSFIRSSRDDAGKPVELYVQDLGGGKPVVLIHGWPLSSASWEYQLAELPSHGLRVVAYDRRGFGKSSQPWSGYDYDTLADDLKSVLDALDLQNVTLVGFSMGGGEIARYMSRHAGNRISRVVFVAAVPPYLLKTADNPEGVDKSVFDQMVDGVKKDRFDFLSTFGKMFYGVGLLSHPVSEATLQWSQTMAAQASRKATLDCIRAFSETDFRRDLATIKVPALVIHGDDDKTVPASVSGERTAKMIPGARYLSYAGAPHGLNVTHQADLNRDLISFINT